jgi:hypothetical protein
MMTSQIAFLSKLGVSCVGSVMLCLGLSGAARAEDRANIETTQIVGNRELPKVLYIVPWKKPTPAELAGRAPSSLLDEVLAPIDRDVFRRQINFAESRAAQAAVPPEAARP